MWKGGPGIDLLGENAITTDMEVYILDLVGIFYSATEHQRQLLICLATTVSWIVLGILHTGIFTSHLKGEVVLYLVFYIQVYVRRILRTKLNFTWYSTDRSIYVASSGRSWIVFCILHARLFTSHLKGEVELYLVFYIQVYLRRILWVKLNCTWYSTCASIYVAS